MHRSLSLRIGLIAISLLLIQATDCSLKAASSVKPVLKYTVSMPDPASHLFQVSLSCDGWSEDSVVLVIPKWTPGYYQLMDYGKQISQLVATDRHRNRLTVKQLSSNRWQLQVAKHKPFQLRYAVFADRPFVATSFLDSTHGYLIPASAFFYLDGHTETPVSVTVRPYKSWKAIATGLDTVPGNVFEYRAPNMDILYDCPLLIGNLKAFPPFTINGSVHRFIAYQPGQFDQVALMANLKKVIKAGIDIIGDIPYRQYTFIGIGPGQGGIEHLNNTTVSFDGNGLNEPESAKQLMNYLAHEYFHHYNVKRIRPFELGPFDYSKEDRTNLLWMSEGLTVYYNYLMVRRAGLTSEQDFLAGFERNIDAHENNEGRLFQSLTQAGYNTWSDGPFGQRGKSISYYEKGPLVGLILDLSIRHTTQNRQSLDDVMRLLYRTYYQTRQRGLTDAEFQEACETVAGTSLSPEFEYVYTTKTIDYNTYLSYAGLVLHETLINGHRTFTLTKSGQPDSLQQAILKGIQGE